MIIVSCTSCDMLGFRSGLGAVVTEVPQTRDRRQDCGFVHGWEVVGMIDARTLAHVALSTLLRSGTLPDWHVDGIHIVQRDLAAQNIHRRVGWPSRLIDGHGVSSDGLVVARLMARWVAGQSQDFRESSIWRSAGGLLGHTL